MLCLSRLVEPDFSRTSISVNADCTIHYHPPALRACSAVLIQDWNQHLSPSVHSNHSVCIQDSDAALQAYSRRLSHYDSRVYLEEQSVACRPCRCIIDVLAVVPRYN